MNGGVGIFVKTPGLSPVKTRLAAGIGVEPAERWFRRAARATAAAASRVSGLKVYWAVAEPATLAAEAWRGLPLLEQGDGELGERMGRVHLALLARHGFGLLLGADTPQLDPLQLAKAADWLAADEARLVMGPARDGGFWLLGANRALEPGDWTRTPCGRCDTARGFRDAMWRHGRWQLLNELTDVDSAADLEPMLAELAALQGPCPEQQALADWTRATLARR
jgi:uncharacterized protein